MSTPQYKPFLLLFGAFTAALISTNAVRAQAPVPAVRGVLFYSPSCGHCHYVITEVLPPLQARYGSAMDIRQVDTSTETGHQAFMLVVHFFEMDSAGVPLLAIGDQYLVGSIDIPEQLPGIIESRLGRGGLDWPAIPGLREALGLTSAPAEALPATESSDWLEQARANLARDPGGNALSLAVLAGMLAVLVAAAAFAFGARVPVPDDPPAWLIPALCLAGLFVAGYLAYVELTQTTAVCGPVGDCNTVQQSSYARLFGILPIGVMGIGGYLAILTARRIGSAFGGEWRSRADLAVLGMTAFGFLFSLYLTVLEPFVIGASCAWCLSSAILMTALFWLSLAPGKAALATSTPPPARPARKRR